MADDELATPEADTEKPERRYGLGDPNAVQPPKKTKLAPRDVLEELKAAAEKRKAVRALVDQDPTLQRLILVWPSVSPERPPKTARCPVKLTLPQKIRWYWSMLPNDPIANWIRLSGLPDAPHVRRAVWVAIENLIVLPNGRLQPNVKAQVKDMAEG